MKRRRRPQKILVTALAALATTVPSSRGWTQQLRPLRSCRRFSSSLAAKKAAGKSFPVDDKSGKSEGLPTWTRGLFPPEEETKPQKPKSSNEKGLFRGLFRRKEEQDKQEKDPKKERKRRQKEVRKAKEKEREQWREKKRLEQEAKQREKEKQLAAAKLQKQQKRQAQIAKQKKRNEDAVAAKKKEQTAFRQPKREPVQDKSKASDSGPISAAQKFFSNAWSSGKNKEQWVPVLAKTRLSPGEIVPATVGGIDLLVVASKDGRKLYCIANSCPHLGTPFETGQLVRLPIETNSVSDPGGSSGKPKEPAARRIFTEVEVTKFLQQDGLEDCIVCPLHKTAFALESGHVRGEWCPYPPVLGNIVGKIKKPTPAAVFDIRTRGKNIEVRINTPLEGSS